MVKLFKISCHFIIFASLLLAVAAAKGQDVHFSNVQDMNIWYNPSLKTNKEALVHAGIRSVKYGNIASYTSNAATVDLPFSRGDKEDQDNKSFVNVTVGIEADNATQIQVKMSMAMMAISYALPLDRNNTYLAIGLQAAYTFTRIAYNGFTFFPDYFDRYGPVGSAILADPFRTGYTYQYFTAGIGTAVFHSDLKTQWYIGGSVRHFNKPLTDRYNPASYRLPANYGIQVGYTTAVTNEDAIGGYGNFTWQDNGHEHVFGVLYTRNLSDSANIALNVGVAYRTGAALIPNVGFRTGANRFAFYYECNIPGTALRDFNRRSFEFSYTRNL